MPVNYNLEFEKAYNQLNKRQKSAVDTIEGPLLVIAGPGTGKTQLLSLRVGNILTQTDTPAGSILCLTFTDSAAFNMRSRLNRLIGPESYRVAVHTFHSLGMEIMNQNPEYFFSGANFSPADELRQFQIMQQIFENLEWNDPLAAKHPEYGFSFLRDTFRCISGLKREGLSPSEFDLILQRNQLFLNQIDHLFETLFEDKISKQTLAKLSEVVEKLEQIVQNLPAVENQFLASFCLGKKLLSSFRQVCSESQISGKTTILTEWKNAFTCLDGQKKRVLKDAYNLPKHQSLQRIYQQYEEKMRLLGLFDFDDMLLQVIAVLENPLKPELKYNYQEKFLYFLVDEFQDTNGVQMRLLQNLINHQLNEGRPNVLVVGDPDQSIFKFQGANIGNMLNFREQYPQAQSITLTQNYRSNQQILDIAMLLIEQSQLRMEGVERIVAAI